MAYTQTLKSAWSATRRRKSLWLLGLLAAALGGIGEIELALGNASLRPEGNLLLTFWQTVLASDLASVDGIGGFREVLASNPLAAGLIVLVYALVAAASLLVLWLSVTGLAALVAAAGREGSLRQAWRAGRSRFWPVLGVTVVSKAISLAAVGALAAVAFQPEGSQRPWLFLVSFVIVGLLTVGISFLAKFATIAIVRAGASVRAGLAQAWGVLTGNWLASLEVAVVTFVINAVAVIVWTLVVGLAGVPVSFLLSGASEGRVAATIVVAFLIGSALFALLLAVLTSFYWHVWVAVYEQLQPGGFTAWLNRLFGRRPTIR